MSTLPLSPHKASGHKMSLLSDHELIKVKNARLPLQKQEEWKINSKQKIDGELYPDKLPEIFADGKYKCPRVRKNKVWNSEFGYFATTGTERLWQCDECGQSFRFESFLTRHLLMHTDERPFQCDECGLSFKSQPHLTRHLLTHTGGHSVEITKTTTAPTAMTSNMTTKPKTNVTMGLRHATATAIYGEVGSDDGGEINYNDSGKTVDDDDDKFTKCLTKWSTTVEKYSIPSKIFKYLGGTEGTQNMLPVQLIGDSNDFQLQKELIATERENIRIIEDIARGISNVPEARYVHSDTLANNLEDVEVLFLLDFPTLDDGVSRPMEAHVNGLSRQTTLRALEQLLVDVFLSMGIGHDVATKLTMRTIAIADVLPIGLPSNYATKYKTEYKQLLMKTRNASTQLLRKTISLFKPDVSIVIFGGMAFKNGSEMLQEISVGRLILNRVALVHPMCGNQGYTTPIQSLEVVKCVIEVASKIAMKHEMIKSPLTMEILAQHGLGSEDIYSYSPGAKMLVDRVNTENERQCEANVRFELLLAEQKCVSSPFPFDFMRW